jgi:hypothetical protein
MALTIESVAPDAVLTEIVMEYGEGDGYAQDQLLPSRGVPRKDYKYMTWNKGEFLQGSQFDSRRAPGAIANRVTTAEGTWATGAVEERMLADNLPDEIMENSVNGANYEAAIVKKLRNALRLEVEIALEAELNDTSTHTDATPSVKWDASSAVVIEKNIDAAKEAFLIQCGFEATHIVLPPAVHQLVKRDSSIRSLRKFANDNLLENGNLPSELFGLRVVLPGAIEDSANPGQTASIARVWSSDNAVLLYVNSAASTDPSAMTSVMRFYEDGSGPEFRAYTWRDPNPTAKTTWYAVETNDDIKAVSDCIYIISDVIT